ncbi:hypothetical protein KDL01_05525 [Actinospica durhamensis]|uniref:DUF2207 domain-containing protein n=1 Tax=Actinospica durhamensis TaxID=1508375 RepID=A0A941IMC8_9ACTN|nr:hypothetical protein [Actinospica durhamensis]MBR7832709.1 hypothetical protein [Actinospica durhamensis]
MVGPQDVSPGPEGIPAGLATYMSGHVDRRRLAFERTLVSLAERGWLEITPGDAASSTARLLPAPGTDRLPRSEVLVLDRVRACSRAMPTVPLAVLLDFGEDRHNWMRGFAKALSAEAVAAGLTRRRIRKVLRYPLALLPAVAAGVLGAAADTANRAGGAMGAGLLTFLFALLVTAVLTAALPTPYGREVAAWARTEAAEPQALPPSAPQALLEKDGTPLPAGQAWSSFTGRWRVVTVGPFTRPARGRPRRLLGSFFSTLIITVPCTAVGLLGLHGVRGDLVALAPATLFVLGTLFWLPAYLSRRPYARRVVYRGQLVKKWTQPDDQSEDQSLHCCSVDGGGEEAASYIVPRDLYKKLGVGDLVEVRYSPRWQVLRGIRRLG